MANYFTQNTKVAGWYFFIIMILAAACLASNQFYLIILFLILAFLSLAFVGYKYPGIKKPYFVIPYYFMLVNWAAMLGVYDFIKGKRIVTWKPVR